MHKFEGLCGETAPAYEGAYHDLTSGHEGQTASEALSEAPMSLQYYQEVLHALIVMKSSSSDVSEPCALDAAYIFENAAKSSKRHFQFSDLTAFVLKSSDPKGIPMVRGKSGKVGCHH